MATCGVNIFGVSGTTWTQVDAIKFGNEQCGYQRKATNLSFPKILGSWQTDLYARGNCKNNNSSKTGTTTITRVGAKKDRRVNNVANFRSNCMVGFVFFSS